MRSVITHFYNEEYLLPWWLSHHLELFDHGVLINHNSTDRSLEICHELAPHWAIVNSQLTEFDAYLNDFEVMKHEEGLPGFKIALTTTEFLVAGVPLSEIEARIVYENFQAVALTGAILVDEDPASPPAPERSLVSQKHHGFLELDHPDLQKSGAGYGRIYHRSTVGQYMPGRHSSYLHGATARMEDVFVFKYAFAPWSDQLKSRKAQIAARVPLTDRQRTWGTQHMRSPADLERDYQENKGLAYDLATHPAIAQGVGV